MTKIGIIWDWNGTLLNDMALCIQSMNKLLKKNQLPLLTPEIYRERFTFPVAQYYQSLGFDFSRVSFRKVGMEFMRLYFAGVHGCGLFPDVVNTINNLKSLGVKQVVLSAMEQAALVKMVDHYRITDCFEHVAGIENHLAHGKMEVGHQLLKQINGNSTRWILVGDTVHDYEVAQSLGISCVLLTHGHQNIHRLAKTGAPLLSDLKRLPELIFSPNARA